jgi:hypothetical protein
MKNVTIAFLLAVACCSLPRRGTADDWPPRISAPHFTPHGGSGSGPSSRGSQERPPREPSRQPPQRDPAMVAREKVAERAWVARKKAAERAGQVIVQEIFRVAVDTKPPAATPEYRTVTVEKGTDFFGVVSNVPGTFLQPAAKVGGSHIATEDLQRALSILEAFVGKEPDTNLTDEDRAFLADQAGSALAGSALRVVPRPVAGLDSRGPALEAVTREIAAATEAVDTAVSQRLAVERQLDEARTRGTSAEERNNYTDLVKSEKAARQKLQEARKHVRVVVTGGAQ